jgi:SAM-dependent methyltransferase
MARMTEPHEWATQEHVDAYFEIVHTIPHLAEGDAVLLELLPMQVRRVLDLGTGDGYLMATVLDARLGAVGVAVDMSPPMLARARERFQSDDRVEIVEHNLDDELPELGRFDAVVSRFAIHHCSDERKRSLYEEIFEILEPGGVFLNLEHVSSPTERLQLDFLAACDMTIEDEDDSNILLDVFTQARWLGEIGFEDADCFWKWRELALFGGVKPR